MNFALIFFFVQFFRSRWGGFAHSVFVLKFVQFPWEWTQESVSVLYVCMCAIAVPPWTGSYVNARSIYHLAAKYSLCECECEHPAHSVWRYHRPRSLNQANRISCHGIYLFLSLIKQNQYPIEYDQTKHKRLSSAFLWQASATATTANTALWSLGFSFHFSLSLSDVCWFFALLRSLFYSILLSLRWLDFTLSCFTGCLLLHSPPFIFIWYLCILYTNTCTFCDIICCVYVVTVVCCYNNQQFKLNCVWKICPAPL